MNNRNEISNKDHIVANNHTSEIPVSHVEFPTLKNPNNQMNHVEKIKVKSLDHEFLKNQLKEIYDNERPLVRQIECGEEHQDNDQVKRCNDVFLKILEIKKRKYKATHDEKEIEIKINGVRPSKKRMAETLSDNSDDRNNANINNIFQQQQHELKRIVEYSQISDPVSNFLQDIEILLTKMDANQSTQNNAAATDEVNAKEMIMDSLFNLLALHIIDNNIKLPNLGEMESWNGEYGNDFFQKLPLLFKYYGNSVYKITDNIDFKNKLLQIGNQDFHKININSLFKILEDIIKNNPDVSNHEHLQNIAITLSLFYTEDDNDVDSLRLAEALHEASDINKTFCNTLLSLNLKETISLYRKENKELPTINDVYNVLNKYSKKEIDEFKNIFRDEEQFKDIVLGSGSIEKTEYGLANVIKEFFSNEKHKNILKEINKLTSVPGVGKELGEKIKELIQLVESPRKITLKEVSQKIQSIDELLVMYLNKARNSTFVSTFVNVGSLISKFIHDNVDPKAIFETNIYENESARNKEIDKIIENFQANTSLLVIAKPYVKKQYKNKINEIFLKFQWDELKDKCTNYLGELKDGKAADSIQEYANKFDTILELTNCLGELKNTYRSVKDKITTILNNNVPFDLLTKLITTLAKQSDKFVMESELDNIIEQSSKVNIIDLINEKVNLYQPYEIQNEQVKNYKEGSWNQVSLEKVWEDKHLNKSKLDKINKLFENLDKLLCKVSQTDNDSEEVFICTKNALEKAKKFPDLIDLIYDMLSSCLESKENNASNNYITTLNNITKNDNNIQNMLQIVNAISQDTNGNRNKDIDNQKLNDVIKKLSSIAHAVNDSASKNVNITQNISDNNALPETNTKDTKIANRIKMVADLYRMKPYPTSKDIHGRTKNYIDTLLEKLSINDESQFEEEIKSLDLDPFGVRKDTLYASKIFNIDKIAPNIKNIRNLIQNESLSKDEIEKLGRQFLHINNLGEGERNTYAEGKLPLQKLSREELQTIAISLISTLSNEQGKNKEQLQLILLAVLREVMLRTTGMFPYPTQIIAVLHAINHPKNLLMQIDTGEGKTITSALLAVLEYANDHTVDVCTANSDLANRDLQQLKNFYDFLGIKTAHIGANQSERNYQNKGINYSTVADLSLHQLRAKVEDEKADELNVGNTLTKSNKSLLLDEVDYSVFDNNTLFNYTMNADLSHENTKNIPWLYDLINDLIDSKEFNLSSLTHQQDIDALRDRINDYQKGNKMQVSHFSDSQLSRWLNDACEANIAFHLRNFIITKDKNGFPFALPLNGNVPQPNNSFNGAQQQFLHARLNKKLGNDVKDEEKYRIYPETLVLASETSKSFINHYNKGQNRILGFSGTLGSESELLELKFNLNTEIFSIPSRTPSQRSTVTKAKKNSSELIKAIKKQISPSLSLLPNIELHIQTEIPEYEHLYCKMHGLHYSEWKDAVDLMRDLSLHTLASACLKYDIYKNNLTYTNVQSLESIKNTIFKNAPKIQVILEKVLNHKDLSETDVNNLKDIYEKYKYTVRFSQKELPQPTLIICNGPQDAKKMFADMSGISYEEVQKGKEILKTIGLSFDQNKLDDDVPFKEYSEKLSKKGINYKPILGKLLSSIFKESTDIKLIINKILNEKSLSAFELRTINAISTNTYQQQNLADFEKLKDMLRNDLPSEERTKHSKYLINGIFKNHHKIIDAINIINSNDYIGAKAGIRENAKEYLRNITSAKQYHQFDSNNYFEYELVVGEESQEQRQDKIAKAGNPYTITVSTTLMGRGVDIKPKHQNGTLVIQTYLDTKRNTDQILGRCARNGYPGTYAFIYDTNHIVSNEIVHLDSKNHKKNIRAFEKIQNKMLEKESFIRYTTQKIDEIDKDVMKEFHRYEKLIKILYDLDRLDCEDIVYRNRMMSLNDLRPKIMSRISDAKEELISMTKDCANLEKKRELFDEALNTYKLRMNQIQSSFTNNLETEFLYDHLKDIKADKVIVNDIVTTETKSQINPVWQTTLGLDTNLDINKLDITLLKKSEISELAKLVRDNFNWVERRFSFGYLFERKQIRNAAKEILYKANVLENQPTDENLNDLLNDLKSSKETIKNKISLNRINPFGHQDVKKVINKCLEQAAQLKLFEMDNRDTIDGIIADEIKLYKDRLNEILKRDYSLNNEEKDKLVIIKNMITKIISDNENNHLCLFHDIQYTLNYFFKSLINDKTFIRLSMMTYDLINMSHSEKFKDINHTPQYIFTDDRFRHSKEKQLQYELESTFNKDSENKINTTLKIVPKAGHTCYELIINSNKDLNNLSKNRYHLTHVDNDSKNEPNKFTNGTYQTWLWKALNKYNQKKNELEKKAQELNMEHEEIEKSLTNVQSNNIKEDDTIKPDTAPTTSEQPKGWLQTTKEKGKDIAVKTKDAGIKLWHYLFPNQKSADENKNTASEQHTKEAMDNSAAKSSSDINKQAEQLLAMTGNKERIQNSKIRNDEAIDKNNAAIKTVYQNMRRLSAISNKLNLSPVKSEERAQNISLTNKQCIKRFNSIDELLSFEMKLRTNTLENKHVQDQCIIHNESVKINTKQKLNFFGVRCMLFFNSISKKCHAITNKIEHECGHALELMSKKIASHHKK